MREASRTLTSAAESSAAEGSGEVFSPGMDFAHRYTIIEEIGHGGMGRVYKAIDRSLGISVALKIIRPEYASNPRIIDLFKKETVLARSITSENVVRVHDLGEWENIKYISMDFVEGENLRDLIQASGSLTIAAAVKFGQQICSGLAAAHKAGIIHRDLKPSNVTIDRLGRARVMDFGLAKTIDREDSKGARAVVGTPEYLSPEQARGDRLDQRADIYALGLILYEMITGRPVFEAESLTGYIRKHSEVNPEPPSRFNHLIPAGLESIILKCLKKDRNERFQRVEEVGRALELVVAPEVSKAKPVRPFIVRRLTWVAVCLAVGALAFSLFFHDRSPAAFPVRKSVAVLNFENVTADPSQEKWRAIRNLLLMDLEQSRLLRLVPRERLLQHLNDLRADDSGVYAQEVLDRIASQENIDFFIGGSFIVSDQWCRIDVRILNVRMPETIISRSFNAAAFEEVQDRCDEISLWARQQLGFSEDDLRKDFDKELKKYTTRSIDALLYFFHGLDFYKKGDYEQSSECYLKAIAVDKNFALAYARLAMNYTYEDRFEKVKEYIDKAMSLRKNLSARERLLIEGDYFNFLESDYPRAIEKYDTLLSSYPDDEIALEHQGAIFRNMEEWEKAAQCFERLDLINPNNRITVRNLSFIAEAQGQYAKSAGIIQDNQGVFSTPEEFHFDLALCFFYEGRMDEAMSEVKKALTLNPAQPGGTRLLGHIHRVKGSYDEAEAAYGQLTEEDRPDMTKVDGHFWLANLHLLKGQDESCSRDIEEGLKVTRKNSFSYEELTLLLLKSRFYLLREDFARAYETALKARQKAVEVHYREDEIEALHLKGLSEVALGRLPEARRTVLEMEQIINKIGYHKLLRHGYHLQGMIASARKSWDEAVSDFLKAVETLPQQPMEYDRQAVYLEALASALFQVGNLDWAREQYEKVIALTSGYLTAGAAYARSLYRLGRIFQEKNEPEKARECYQEYLNVFRDADPGRPEVEDARKRLASVT